MGEGPGLGRCWGAWGPGGVWGSAGSPAVELPGPGGV